MAFPFAWGCQIDVNNGPVQTLESDPVIQEMVEWKEKCPSPDCTQTTAQKICFSLELSVFNAFLDPAVPLIYFNEIMKIYI